MKQLISVIQNLGQNEDKYISDNELEIIRDHKVEAAAYFHDVLDQMCSQSKEDTLNDGQLLGDGFFALFFLAEWKDTSAFAKACEILRIMGEDADGWLGDALTENLPMSCISFLTETISCLPVTCMTYRTTSGSGFPV